MKREGSHKIVVKRRASVSSDHLSLLARPILRPEEKSIACQRYIQPRS
jgi:hypothetical protein